MNSKIDVTYLEMESSPSIQSCLNEQLEKVERHWPSVDGCRVVIAAPTTRHSHGGHFRVTVELRVAGVEGFANRDQDKDYSHQDCQAAIRDAFRAALKGLERHRERQHKFTRHPRDLLV